MVTKKATKKAVAKVEEAATIPDRTVNGYLAANPDKWHRAVHGDISREGQLAGGAGEDATPEAKLAAYDRLGGLITKDGRKVKTGSFYDFEEGKARETPDVKLVFRDLEGEEVEIGADEEVPPELRAAEVSQAKKADKNKAKAERAAKPKKAKPTLEDEE